MAKPLDFLLSLKTHRNSWRLCLEDNKRHVITGMFALSSPLLWLTNFPGMRDLTVHTLLFSFTDTDAGDGIWI